MISSAVRQAMRVASAGLWVLPVLLVLPAPDQGGRATQSAVGGTRVEPDSLRAFARVASVLTSPRCLNCHIPGDAPLQGDDERPHNMNVKRGPDGRGTPAMRCTNCHQEANSVEPHGPPGAAGWRLPAPSTPIAWQGLTVGDICRTLKDPNKNGGRSLSQLIEHVRDDRIVNWAWNPGPSRTLPPLSHQEFVEAFAAWVQNGAACPQ